MTPELLLGTVAGMMLAVALLALARLGLRGGRLVGLSRRRFVCPTLHRQVTCELWRNLRTSQLEGVRSCTAFDDPEDVRCELDCAAILNRGLPLEGEQGRL
jgi:hypothetical protein